MISKCSISYYFAFTLLYLALWPLASFAFEQQQAVVFDTTSEGVQALDSDPQIAKPVVQESKVDVQPAQAPPTPTQTQFFIGFGYSLASHLELDDTTYTAGGRSNTWSEAAYVGSAPVVSLGLQYLPQKKWGYEFGASFDFKRKIKNSNTKANNFGTPGLISTGTGISYLTLVANAAFRWENFYLPFGLNYAKPFFNLPGTAVSKLSYSGQIGGQFGLGVFLDEHFRAEAHYRIMHFRTTETGTNYQLDYGDIYLNGILVNLKYGF